MKTANVKWGRGKREATGKKVNARDEFVRPTWIDLDFSSPATAPEILLLLQKTFQRRQDRHVDGRTIGLILCVGVPSKRKG